MRNCSHRNGWSSTIPNRHKPYFHHADQTENTAFRIRIIHIENILMTVQGHHSQLIVIIRKNNPRNIAVRFYRNFQFFCILRRHVIRMQRNFRILLTSLRIFINYNSRDIIPLRTSASNIRELPIRRNAQKPAARCSETKPSGSLQQTLLHRPNR